MTGSYISKWVKTTAELGYFGGKIKKWASQHSNTKDMPFLNQYKGHPVFIYGTLKGGGTRASILEEEECHLIACAVTKHPMAVCLANPGTIQEFPVAFRANEKNPYYGYLVGQLWVVPTEMLAFLDALESTPLLYTREREKIQLMSKPNDNRFQMYEVTSAWMYQGNMSYWLDSKATLPALEPHQHLNTGRRFLNYNRKSKHTEQESV